MNSYREICVTFSKGISNFVGDIKSGSITFIFNYMYPILSMCESGMIVYWFVTDECTFRMSSSEVLAIKINYYYILPYLTDSRPIRLLFSLAASSSKKGSVALMFVLHKSNGLRTGYRTSITACSWRWYSSRVRVSPEFLDQWIISGIMFTE